MGEPSSAPMRPLRLVIEAALVCSAKRNEAFGRRLMWADLARDVADDPDIAEAYALLAEHRAKTSPRNRDHG